MCVFSKMKDIKHIRRDFHSVALAMPKGRDLGYRGGRWLGSDFFPEIQPVWCVSYLHEGHMQWHNCLSPRPHGALGRGHNVKYHQISITKSISKIINQTLCVFSPMKDIKEIRRDFTWPAGSGPGVGLGGTVGVGVNFIF